MSDDKALKKFKRDWDKVKARRKAAKKKPETGAYCRVDDAEQFFAEAIAKMRKVSAKIKKAWEDA